MLIELPVILIILINIILLFIIHIGSAYLLTMLPSKFINTGSWIYKERNWEQSGKVYEKLFKIKSWKGKLPDGAALFSKGFRKKHIRSNDLNYINSFILETCRGELVHWAVIWVSPLFFIWNWWWGGIIIILYALFANIPCIITQRYNRIRFRKILNKHFRNGS